ncbi:hypothetical protein COLO4_36335 [Corchorus olitorius]|uniref:Uncharacterized protein n=1 Tax=Corchorus olitorius TaxID=93759 RepID=A0A1R3G9U7_9ROSI|nr:hypothetical protein COLO4_36335 [Corchorus olitorius]
METGLPMVVATEVGAEVTGGAAKVYSREKEASSFETNIGVGIGKVERRNLESFKLAHGQKSLRRGGLQWLGWWYDFGWRRREQIGWLGFQLGEKGFE